MKCERKYKLRVVNLGVKLFCKNRDDKSVGKVSKNKFSNYFIS